MGEVTIKSVDTKQFIISNPVGTRTITLPPGAVTYAKGQLIARNLSTGAYGKYNSGATNGLEQIQGIYVGEDTVDTTAGAKQIEILIAGEVRADGVVGSTLFIDYKAQLQLDRLGIYLK